MSDVTRSPKQNEATFSSYSNIYFNIILRSNLRAFQTSVHVGLFNHKPVCSSRPFHACYMPNKTLNSAQSLISSYPSLCTFFPPSSFLVLDCSTLQMKATRSFETPVTTRAATYVRNVGNTSRHRRLQSCWHLLIPISTNSPQHSVLKLFVSVSPIYSHIRSNYAVCVWYRSPALSRVEINISGKTHVSRNFAQTCTATCFRSAHHTLDPTRRGHCDQFFA